MTHPPADIAEGVKLATAAAEEDSGEAAYLMALSTAAGITVPQSWRAALDFLQRAAKLDHGIARTELAPLARASRRQSRGVRVFRARLGALTQKIRRAGAVVPSLSLRGFFRIGNTGIVGS